MSKDNLTKKQLGPRPLWFNALLLLDAFALGGLVAMELVRQLLEIIGNRLITVEAQSVILHVLDHLLPYWLGYVGVSLLLGLITVGAYLWLKTRARIMITLTLLIPLNPACFVLRLTGRIDGDFAYPPTVNSDGASADTTRRNDDAHPG